MAEPGAVVAGRIAGQAHDRVPQFGEAFRQILHVGRGLAGAGPCFRQEPSGIGPGAGHSVEIVGVSLRCQGIEHWGLHWVASGGTGMPAEVTLPRTARIVPAVLLPASPCRVARLTRFARKRCPRFPSVAVIQPPAMADRAARSNPSRASSGRKSQHGGLGCPSRPAGRRRKFAEAGRGTATTVRTPRAGYRGTCDLR